MNRPAHDQAALLEAILDSIAAICVLDPEGRIVFANRRAEEILGLSRSEICRRRYDAPEWKSTAIDGGPWPDENQPFSIVMRTGRPVQDVRHAIEWPDGQRKLLSINGAPIKNERGEITRLVFSVSDITERVTTERRVRESGEWLRLALESAQMGIWSWEIGTGRVRLSDEVAALFGIEAGRFGGTYQDYVDLVHPDDLARVSETIRSTLASGSESYSIEHRVLRPDGDVRWIEGRGRIFRDDDGRPTRISGSIMDVTTRKTVERALRESQEQLRHSQRMESVGRLAGGVAHDFNNLLTAISGAAELASEQLQDRPDERALIDQIVTAADQGASLTRQLLSFSLQQVVQPKVVDLNERITNANGLLHRLIGEHIELKIDLAADLWPAEIDPGQFEQVLVNLAVNAHDAMPRGGRLTITSSNLPGSGSEEARVVVTVEDNGTGMDADTQRLAFEPFFTTKERGKGTGLGLATCLGIVGQAGGRITVESEPGRGARFRILLPRCEKTPAERLQGQRGKDLHKGTETILLVEDDPMVRRVTRTALKRAGYDLLEAADGLEALRAFEATKGRVELLITDVVMPQMSGAELAAELLERDPSLKVLFVSGYSPDLGSLSELVDRGVNLFPKPFSGSELSKKVREILETDGRR